MVAAEGAPAERNLGEVAGAEHESPFGVGNIEQDLGALSGLGVFVGRVVDVGVMADVLKMLGDAFGNRNFPESRAKLAN